MAVAVARAVEVEVGVAEAAATPIRFVGVGPLPPLVGVVEGVKVMVGVNVYVLVETKAAPVAVAWGVLVGTSAAADPGVLVAAGGSVGTSAGGSCTGGSCAGGSCAGGSWAGGS
jgi:hypothetical protein